MLSKVLPVLVVVDGLTQHIAGWESTIFFSFDAKKSRGQRDSDVLLLRIINGVVASDGLDGMVAKQAICVCMTALSRCDNAGACAGRAGCGTLVQRVSVVDPAKPILKFEFVTRLVAVLCTVLYRDHMVYQVHTSYHIIHSYGVVQKNEGIWESLWD